MPLPQLLMLMANSQGRFPFFLKKSFFCEGKQPKRLESASVCQEKGFMCYLKRGFPRGDVREVHCLLNGWNLWTVNSFKKNNHIRVYINHTHKHMLTSPHCGEAVANPNSACSHWRGITLSSSKGTDEWARMCACVHVHVCACLPFCDTLGSSLHAFCFFTTDIG